MTRRPDWPEQVKYGRDPVLANFRHPFPQAKAAKAADRRAAREGNSLPHLAMVRQLWCSLGHRDDRREALHAHHLQGGPCRNRGLGKRSPDVWTVPLVWWRHEELHALGSRHEYEYFMDHSHGRVDPYALAIALKAISPDILLAARILEAHQRQDATLTLLGLGCATLEGRA